MRSASAVRILNYYHQWLKGISTVGIRKRSWLHVDKVKLILLRISKAKIICMYTMLHEVIWMKVTENNEWKQELQEEFI